MNWREWLAPENIGFVTVGIVVGAISLIGVESACDADVAARAQRASASTIGGPKKDPGIDAELLRCAQLPIEEAEDPTCKGLWAKERRRFLKGEEPAPPAQKPVEKAPPWPRPLDGSTPKPAPKSE
jgi:conjugative transfer region protein TrbK